MGNREIITEIPFNKVLKRVWDNNKKATFLGVGPVSENVVRASFRAFKDYNAPAIFIASRNQVDSYEFGGGYLMGGMDGKEFVNLLFKIAKEESYNGLLYICRDHGGPWQRDAELNNKIAVDKAMDIARKSFKADIEAGFNYLHIDPTKCPHNFDLKKNIEWTTELISFISQELNVLGKENISLEVGTEDIKGGTTSPEDFKKFIEELTTEIKRQNLLLPCCVVGQTGTLTKMDKNVGYFNEEVSKKLIDIAKTFNMGLKEHNGDYLSDEVCEIHPTLGIAAMNVAPEFGAAETEALLQLEMVETDCSNAKKSLPHTPSEMKKYMEEDLFKQGVWRKWLTNDLKEISTEQIRKSEEISQSLLHACGHYTFNSDEVITRRKILYENIKSLESVNPEEFVISHIQESISRYLKHLNLRDSNTFLLKECNVR